MRATSAGMRAAAMVGAAALAAGLAVAVPTAAGAADLPGPNVGTEGASQGPTTTLTGVPDGATAPKAESKTWYANGFWWASMKNPLGDGYTIHRLANRDTGGTPTWVNTAIGIDPRNNTAHRVGRGPQRAGLERPIGRVVRCDAPGFDDTVAEAVVVVTPGGGVGEQHAGAVSGRCDRRLALAAAEDFDVCVIDGHRILAK